MIVRSQLEIHTVYAVFELYSRCTSETLPGRAAWPGFVKISAQIRTQIHTYTDCAGAAKTVQCATEEIMLIILLVVLLVLSLGSLPSWPYSRGWGYYPSGGLGLVVVVLVILLLLGRI
jgi:Protein of unknown function (DUF3309)